MSILSRLGDFLDERTGHRKLLAHALDEPIRGGARWAYVFGSALLGSFLVQAVTGIALMTSYAPSDKTAWASVHYITFTQSGGWLVRGLHHFGIGTGKGFQTRGGSSIGTAVVTLKLSQIIQILT